MLRRTSGRVKLLVFGLLRTVSALATTEHKVFPYLAQAQGVLGGQPAPDITLRLARRSDVTAIQRCNLATLPENYNQQFYNNHLRQWPELVIVAESSEPLSREHQPIYNPFPSSAPESHVVAYVIGKVEEHVKEVFPNDDSRYFSQHDRRMGPTYTTEKLGHVTSLAVLDGFRRQGLAQDLMKQLHHHMESCYGVDSVGLHVRVSNAPAARLYNSFGYVVAEVIPAYYQDGEDAYLMKKWFVPESSQQPNNHVPSLFGNLRRAKPWESGPLELRLPRLVGRPQPPQQNGVTPGIMREAT